MKNTAILGLPFLFYANRHPANQKQHDGRFTGGLCEARRVMALRRISISVSDSLATLIINDSVVPPVVLQAAVLPWMTSPTEG